MSKTQKPLTLEITVISAEGLKNSTLFAHKLRTFVTLSTHPATSQVSNNGTRHVYRTRVDENGGNNPTWQDKIHLPVENDFFRREDSEICVRIFAKCRVVGKRQVGWCPIPVRDIAEGFRPAGQVRFLSYAVRSSDGGRGDGVIDLAVRLVGPESGSVLVCNYREPAPAVTSLPAYGIGQTAIGIPVSRLCPPEVPAGECPPLFYWPACGSCNFEETSASCHVSLWRQV